MKLRRLSEEQKNSRSLLGRSYIFLWGLILLACGTNSEINNTKEKNETKNDGS